MHSPVVAPDARFWLAESTASGSVQSPSSAMSVASVVTVMMDAARTAAGDAASPAAKPHTRSRAPARRNVVWRVALIVPQLSLGRPRTPGHGTLLDDGERVEVHA